MGAFTLVEVVGAGAMGQVWLARHARSGDTVALKVLSGELAEQTSYRAAFRAEVRAVARLDHPGIVRVYDYGALPSEAASRGLTAGSPWLAMERLDGALRPPRHAAWPWLSRVLHSILAALAHAHARGVVHRDLKPANLMWRGDEVCLVDFGLAHALDSDGSDAFGSSIVGTPSYMAPEQVTGERRELGPWTDLYAVGCVAYRFACGRPPFSGDGRSNAQVMAARLHEDVPPLRARYPVPHGFEDWVRRCLERDPRHRFRHAADAAWALRGLGRRTSADDEDGLAPDVDGDTPELVTGDFVVPDSLWLDGESVVSRHASRAASGAGDVRRDDPDATVATARRARDARDPAGTQLGGATVVSQTGLDAQLADEGHPAGTRSTPSFDVPPMPADWRDARAASGRDGGVSGVGLGLFGLREAPLIGRDAARDQLWDVLRDVFGSGHARAVVVRGPAGSGKSRLVRWLTRRSAELGVAQSLCVTHDEIPGTNHGFRPALTRHLDVVESDARATHHRVVECLTDVGIRDPDEAATLSAWLHDGEDAVGFRTPAERNRLVRRVLGALAHFERPRIVWLDDAHLEPTAIDFALGALDVDPSEDAPLMVILTVTDEVLSDTHLAAHRLDALAENRRCDTLTVGPLDLGESRELIEKLLGIDASLAAQLITRAAGSPSFIVHLVSDWVQRGVLVPGERGFELADGAAVELPESLLDVWLRRVDALTSTPQGQAALELAAALGQKVDVADWHEACASEGCSSKRADALLERMLERALATEDARDASPTACWSFANVMLREAIEQSATTAGRWAARHRTCASVFSARGDADDERLGRHLAEAGEYDAALRPLVDGAAHRVDDGEYDHAEVLLQRCEAIVERLGLDGTDPRVIDLWTNRARLARLTDAHEASRTWSRKAVEAGRAGDAPEACCRALMVRAAILRNAGENERAIDVAREALTLVETRGDPTLTAQSRRTLGICCMVSGRLDEARQWLESAHEAFGWVEDGDETEAGICLQALAVVAMRRGDADAAIEHIERALSHYDAAHSRYWKANATNDRADFLRHLGQLDDAEAGYMRAIEIFESLGVSHVVPRINLGAMFIERGELEAATAQLRGVTDTLRESERRGLLAQVICYLLPCHTGTNALDAFDETVEEAETLIAETRVAAVDCGRWAERAGHELLEAGESARALRALDIALDQWSRLGRDDDAVRVRALSAKLKSDAAPSTGAP